MNWRPRRHFSRQTERQTNRQTASKTAESNLKNACGACGNNQRQQPTAKAQGTRVTTVIK